VSQQGPAAVIVAHAGSSIGGGAGSVAFNVHRALRDSGVTSRFFAIDPSGVSAAAEVIRFPRPSAARNSARSLLFRLAVRMHGIHRPRGSGLFSYTSLPIHSPFPFDIVRPDVIHLHWIAQGIDYRSFFDSIPPSLPIVWTLLDMEPVPREKRTRAASTAAALHCLTRTVTSASRGRTACTGR
jgi:hypothetical protein